MSTPTTRERIVQGAFDSLRTKGFAGTSARSIAALAEVNPGLIYHYFDSVEDVLVATLTAGSEDRLQRHRAAIEGVGTATELVAALRAIYDEDRASGHIRVVSELVAAGVSRPELGRRVMAEMQPWLDLAEQAVSQALGDSPMAELVPPRQVALAGVTFYLGANLMTHLSDGAEPVDELFATAEQATALVDALASAADG